MNPVPNTTEERMVNEIRVKQSGVSALTPHPRIDGYVCTWVNRNAARRTAEYIFRPAPGVDGERSA
jgi:hypothetical protein